VRRQSALDKGRVFVTGPLTLELPVSGAGSGGFGKAQKSLAESRSPGLKTNTPPPHLRAVEARKTGTIPLAT